ncbi:HTH-type transcriptional repressor BdcR [compost metagenome]|uniref:TetR/AcrR family transcriptional regulator n=1 Tax=Cupriavidus campinensis TaxID=151783 RepID=A0ABY3EE78_9BURK|nr:MULTISPECIES: TetR/AcrR family transcriptional regulator [Cupriavidus]TSP09212.1 TetR/AcrR family transcriptional regulator [Cupriavidus campinensis]CAG2134382.1 hypothetical protein LMG19282_00913 [Cupriavidus campinensis]
MARPRQFDAAAALAAAQNTFLDKGYQATSTRELTQAMGLTQPSLYNAFGDKRSLFLLALDDYLNKSLRARIARAEANHPPAQAIAAFFGESVERALADPQHRGCMLINASLDASSDDPALREVVAEELDDLRAFFERSVRAAQAAGTLDAGFVPEDVAANLLAVQVGLRVLSRVMPERALLEAMVRQALSMLNLPSMPPPSC